MRGLAVVFVAASWSFASADVLPEPEPAAIPPAPAPAARFTFGAALGASHSARDADANLDASQTQGLFGRINLTSRVAGQLELARLATEDGSGVRIRTTTAALVIDLVDGDHRWYPTIIAAAGLDKSRSDFSDQDGHHVEVGVGIEHRTPGGFTFGADVRLGGRTLDNDDIVFEDTAGGGVVFLAPNRLESGDYRALRAWLGVRF